MKKIILFISDMYKYIGGYIICWVVVKWYMAVDLPYIILPIIGINYNPKMAEIFYIISVILGAILTIMALGTSVGYIIGCIKDVKKYREN
nr:MAG TPA: hypothetical protein [Caudoviricetes sp.]